jgi:hypothetical protein
MKFHVAVLTHERPALCAALLGDLARDVSLSDFAELSVTVFDDASKADYSYVKYVMESCGWEYVRADRNHGIVQHWEWVDRILKSHRDRDADIFIQIPDDVRLCIDFFETAIGHWWSIPDEKKAVLNLLRDHRDAQWGSPSPQSYGLVRETGWTDGAHLYERNFLKMLNYSIPQIQRPAHVAGTGVWAHVSRTIRQQGMSLYQTKRSLIAHVSDRSVMHPEARAKQPIHTKYFIDGPRRLEELCTEVTQ